MSEQPEAGERTSLPCPQIVRGQEHLTPEQEAYARQFAEERITAMLSTAPIDEAEAEEHLRQTYRAAGLEPVPVRWFDSPMTFVMGYFDGMLDGVGVSVEDQVLKGAEKSAWASVQDSVQKDVRVSVQNCVWERVWEGVWVRDSLWDRVRSSARFTMWSKVQASNRASVQARLLACGWIGNTQDGMRESVGKSVQAYHGENCYSYYRFFHEVFAANRLISLALFNELVSGYLLGSNEAWVVRKPIHLKHDEQGHLHSDTGMALQYHDGWGLYAWHGMFVPEKIILHPEQISRDDWLHERNVEMRRLMQERLSNEQFVELVGATPIDHGQWGILVEVDLGTDPERVARFVQVKDHLTQRHYYLRVPPSITRADEAVAWTFGLDEADYHPLQET